MVSAPGLAGAQGTAKIRSYRGQRLSCCCCLGSRWSYACARCATARQSEQCAAHHCRQAFGCFDPVDKRACLVVAQGSPGRRDGDSGPTEGHSGLVTGLVAQSDPSCRPRSCRSCASALSWFGSGRGGKCQRGHRGRRSATTTVAATGWDPAVMPLTPTAADDGCPPMAAEAPDTTADSDTADHVPGNMPGDPGGESRGSRDQRLEP